MSKCIFSFAFSKKFTDYEYKPDLNYICHYLCEVEGSEFTQEIFNKAITKLIRSNPIEIYDFFLYLKDNDEYIQNIPKLIESYNNYGLNEDLLMDQLPFDKWIDENIEYMKEIFWSVKDNSRYFNYILLVV
jgi:hypothetical protein